jgi:hypothetical protein
MASASMAASQGFIVSWIVFKIQPPASTLSWARSQMVDWLESGNPYHRMWFGGGHTTKRSFVFRVFCF